MEQAQLDQIIQAYVNDPNHRAELHHNQLTVFPGNVPRWRALGGGLLMVMVAVAAVAWIVISVRRSLTWDSLLWAFFVVVLLVYLVIGVVAIRAASRSSLTIDLTTGDATANYPGGNKRVASLADGLSFAVMRLKQYTFVYTFWFPFHCMLTTAVNGQTRSVFLIGFATMDDYNAFAPVLDALLHRFGRVAPSGAPPQP